MTLSALIRKRHHEYIATATCAIPATQDDECAGAIAKIATLAVANNTERQAAHSTIAPMSFREETAILGWLDFIGETDSVLIAEIIEKCQQSADARGYFIGRAAEVPHSEKQANTVTCRDCHHSRTTRHPSLVDCSVGSPPPACGSFWADDSRYCEMFAGANASGYI